MFSRLFFAHRKLFVSTFYRKQPKSTKFLLKGNDIISKRLYSTETASSLAQTSPITTESTQGDRKLAISFVCKSCEHRSHHTMSHHAYTKGIVIVECPKCTHKHLIADNLGWFPGEPRNIEEALKSKGESVRWLENQ